MNRSKKIISMLCMLSVAVASIFMWSGCQKITDGPGIPMEDNTTIENPTADHSQYTPTEQFFILAGKLKTVNSYRSVVKGETKSASPEYVQTINDIHIKNGSESFMESTSTSFLVNMGKQSYFKGEKVAFRDATNVKNHIWSQDVMVARRRDYRKKIGEEPTVLSNHLLSYETILNPSVVNNGDGTYTAECDIDVVKGTARYAVKMLDFGGLKSYPKFESCHLLVIFDETWHPLVVKTNDVYLAEKGMLTMRCTSELTETFYDYDKPQDIPDVEMFRKKVLERPTFTENENQEIEGTELFTDTILDLDIKNGIKINGNLKGTFNGKNLVLPIDAWMAFDFDKLKEGSLNDGFSGRVDTSLAGIPIKIFYVGDSYLYVDFGTTKYKYPLSGSDEHVEVMDNIASLIEITEGERDGNMRHFTLKVKDQFIKLANMFLKSKISSLPIDIEELKDLEIKDLSVKMDINKVDLQTGNLSQVTIDSDLNIAKLQGTIVIAEMTEKLPDENVLANYKEVNSQGFSDNFAFVGKLFKGISTYDLENGIGFNLNLGLYSAGNAGANLLFPFPAGCQVAKEGLKMHLNFGLGALLGMPSEIFLSNGSIYLVTTATDSGKVYPSVVQEIKLADSFGSLSDILNKLQDKNPDIDKLIETLADVATNSVVKTENFEDGTQRLDLYLCDNATRKISTAYRNLWKKAGEADLGDMGALAGQFIKMFDFDVDNVIIRTEYKGEMLTSMSVRLYNESTSVAGGGKDLSFIVELKDGSELPPYQIEKDFTLVEDGLIAMEESKDVRSDIAEILENGITHIGASFGEKISAVEEKYSALSKEAQLTVADYKKFTALKAEWTKLKNDADKFIETLKKVNELDRTPLNEAEIDNLFLNELNPIYEKLETRQKEYIGAFALEQYDYLRRKIENSYSVKTLVENIDKLTAENYPLFKDFDKAIKDVKKQYDNLLDENKAKVTNFEKISVAEKECRIVELNEFNNSLKVVSDDINNKVATADYNTLKALKSTYDSKLAIYNKLSQEEKQLVTNYNEFILSGDSLFGKIKDEFLRLYNEIGGEANIVAGDACYNLVDSTKKYGDLLSADQKTQLKAELDNVKKYVSKHRTIETQAVDKLINAIGTVEFTKECHDKIVTARTAFENIRTNYFSYVSKRNVLMNAEVNYVKASIGDLTPENVLPSDGEKLLTARNYYNEATSAYSKNKFYQRSIKNKLADFEKTLSEMENIIK